MTQLDIAPYRNQMPTELQGDLVLPDDIRPHGRPDTSTGSILVTGATGFLGSAVLAEALAECPDTHVYCLIRSAEDNAAIRLRTYLDNLCLWDESWAGRITAVVGDLSNTSLGLSQKDAEILASEVSLIYHSGAAVNLALPYAQVRDVNIDGTIGILRLATTQRPKRVVHMSTMSTVDITAHTDNVLQQPAPLGHFDDMVTGYARSKWVAELLVEQAAARGLDRVNIRMGALSGHTRTGVSNANDYAWLMLIACLEVGSTPIMNAPTNWLPVDDVARATVRLGLLPEAAGIHQILPSHQITYAQLFSWLRRAGFRLSAASFPLWRERILAQAIDGSRNVRIIGSVLPAGGLPGGAESEIRCIDTERTFASFGIPYPRLTEDGFNRLLQTARRRGEIPALENGSAA